MFSENKFQSKNRPSEYLDYLEFSNGNSPKKALFFYIHGAGSLGNDLSKLSRVGLLEKCEQGKLDDKDVVVIAPQCHAGTWFEMLDVLLEFIGAMRKREDIDISRVYICGSSMGGYATWATIMARPDWFAAAIPVCGGGMYWNSYTITNLPIWAFHGALDKTVYPIESINMVEKINSGSGHAKITILPEVGHNAWDYAFDKETLDWAFSQQNNNAEKGV